MIQKITLGSGCFWCVEAIYQQLKGVNKVSSGYSGGKIANPTYREVCSGLTGHAEVVQIEYDESLITLAELLEIFFRTHDPTTLNRQGADIGTQYRSVIFFHNEEQGKLAQNIKEELDNSGAFESPIVTEISPFESFYEAEDYHKNYYKEHPEESYCKLVIQPKVEKFQKVFENKLQ